MTRDDARPDSLYRVLFEKNPAPSWVYDLETMRFLMVNEAAVATYGFSRDEFATMTLADIRPPDERPKLATLVRERRDGEYLNMRHWTKHGVHMDVRMVSHAITLAGRSARLVVAEDITEQRRTSEQLRSRVIQQEALAELGHRALQDGASAVLVRDAAALVARTLGLAVAQIVERGPAGHPVAHASVVAGGNQSLSAAGRAVAAAMLQLSARNGGPLVIDDMTADARFAADRDGIASAAAIEIPGIAFDGALVALATTPRRFGGDDVNYLRAVAATLGAALERNRAERARQESEERAFDILNSLSESVVLLADGARIHWCNRTAAMLLGCPADQVIGRSSSELGLQLEDIDGRRLTPEELPTAIAMRTDQASTRLVRMNIQGRPIRWALMSAQSLHRGDRASPLAAVVSFVDVTESRRVEEQLLQAQRLEAVGRLAGGVAHDFNNILTVIRSYCEMIHEQIADNPQLCADMDEIIGATDRAVALTRQLLTFGRRTIVSPQPLLLNEVITGLRPMIPRLLREDIGTAFSLDPKLSTVVMDPGQFEQVLLNLIVNARDAMPRGGRLVVETRDVGVEPGGFLPPDMTEGRYVMLAVSDTGVGMPPEVRDRIFEPFFTTKAPGEGTGLGLATVYGVVKAAGGHIVVYSEPAIGTTFRVYLPISDLAPNRTAEFQVPVQPKGGAGEHILLAEDDVAVRRVLVQQLRRLGYRVTEARSGDHALEIARNLIERVDMLMTDMVMPGLNGRELAMAVRDTYPGLRVLFTSGYSSDIIAADEFADAGAAYLEKPFSIADLARHVRAVLDSPAFAFEQRASDRRK